MKRSIEAAVFLIGLLLALCASVQANTLTLDDQAYYDAAPELRWLDGGDRELAPEQALRWLREGQGRRLSDSYPALGFRQEISGCCYLWSTTPNWTCGTCAPPGRTWIIWTCTCSIRTGGA